jgi:LEA14-like dessication related protein
MANGSRGDRSPDGTGTDGKVDGDDGSRLSALVATTPRAVATLVVALVLLVVVAYFLGIVGVPSAGLVDRGDWGTVTEERTEVITTVWVDNTNPFPIALGDGLSADYEVAFNGVALASGEKDAIEVPKGNSTIELRTNLRNDRLPAWWVAFVRANETVAMDINGTLSVDVGPTVSHDIHVEQTALEDSTPIISALSAAANGTRGTYTQSVGSDQVSDDVDLNALSDEEVTVGYEVREGSARWGEVTEEQTTVVFEFTVHNPGDVPVPAVPDGLGVTVDMNDVRLFRGESGDLSASSVSPDAVIPPGETQTVEFTVRMDNEKVDEWFTSHVRRDERTAVSTGLQLVFEVPPTGQTVRLPRNSPVTYDCQLQTAILVDDQTTETNCGEPGSAAGGGSDDGDGTTSGTATRTTVATRTTLVAHARAGGDTHRHSTAPGRRGLGEHHQRVRAADGRVRRERVFGPGRQHHQLHVDVRRPEPASRGRAGRSHLRGARHLRGDAHRRRRSRPAGHRGGHGRGVGGVTGVARQSGPR